MRLIYPENLEDIALGAAVLGGGGGADPYVAKLMGIDALRTCGPVQLVSPDEISDVDYVPVEQRFQTAGRAASPRTT